MDSVYTTTITNAAKSRGISVRVLDGNLPIFELNHDNRSVRCYNGLTDRVGAATFHLANDKGAAHRFLKANGLPVPAQEPYTTYDDAKKFLNRYKSVVVKPVSQWGARGISTHITTLAELRSAIVFARRYATDVVLEECVKGVDYRLIFVDYTFVAAIERTPAAVTGNGIDSIRKLITRKNIAARRIDPSNTVPLDKETKRCIESQGYLYTSVLPKGQALQVRRTSNFHTGGSVEIITERAPQELRTLAGRVAALFQIPVVAIDFLVDQAAGEYRIIEVSPDMAISPPEGAVVAEAFLDMLFPHTKPGEIREPTIPAVEVASQYA